MSNISDKDIDRLFQQAADSYDTPFEEQMWAQMEKKLAAHGGSGFNFYHVVGGVIAAVILSVSVVMFIAHPKRGPKNPAEHGDSAGLAEITNNDISTTGTQIPKLRPQAGHVAGSSGDTQVQANQAKGNNLSGAGLAKETKENGQHDKMAGTGAGNKSGQRSIVPHITDIRNREIHAKTEDTDNSQAFTRLGMDKRHHNFSNQNEWGIGYLQGIPVETGYDEHLVIRDFISFEQEEKYQEEELFDPYFAMKLVYTPDVSSVGYFSPDKPGHDYGIIGEYYFTGRWAVSLGAILAHKIYYSNEDPGGAYGGYPVDKLNGECKVIDIPINASYFMYKSEKQGFYVSLGVSSYLMLSEDYKFQYSNEDGYWEWEQHYNGENKHFFGLANVSIGYERKIKGNLFLQLEPFVKAPFVGIGAGEIELVSSGAFINLKYKFKNRPKN